MIGDRRWRRRYHRVLRVALTLADLGGEARVGKAQLMEAIGYRQLDRMLKANDPTRA